MFDFLGVSLSIVFLFPKSEPIGLIEALAVWALFYEASASELFSVRARLSLPLLYSSFNTWRGIGAGIGPGSAR
jgi:hypothetical protein